MEARSVDRYRVSPRGGTNPIDVFGEDGRRAAIGVLQFRTDRIAGAVAAELNRAYEAGYKAGQQAGDGGDTAGDGVLDTGKTV